MDERSKQLYERDIARLDQQFREEVDKFGRHRWFWFTVVGLLLGMAYFA